MERIKDGASMLRERRVEGEEGGEGGGDGNKDKIRERFFFRAEPAGGARAAEPSWEIASAFEAA